MKRKSLTFPKRAIASRQLWIHLLLSATAFTIFPLVVSAQTGADSEAGKIGLAHRSAGLEHFKARNYAEAYEEFTEALNPLERAYGTGHKQVGSVLNLMGMASHYLGKYDRAIEEYRRALKIRLAVYGPKAPRTADVLNNLAYSEEYAGRLKDALAHHRDALSIRENALGKEHPTVARSYGSLGKILSRLGKHEEALAYHERAVKFFSAGGEATRADLAVALSDMANTCLDLGHYDRAQTQHQKALDIYRKLHGDRDLRVATGLANLAGACYHGGDYSRATKLTREALDIRLEIQGNDHPDIANVRSNLGVFLKYSGDYARAMDEQKEALRLLQASFGSDHPKLAATWNNLGELHRVRGELKPALECAEKAVAIKRKTLGSDHPSVGISLDNAGTVAWLMEDYDQALEYHREALEILENRLGSDHPAVSQARNNLAAVLHKRGDNAGASAELERAAATLRARGMTSSMHLALFELNLALILEEKSDFKGARAAVRRGLSACLFEGEEWEGRSDSLRPLPVAVTLLFQLSRLTAKAPANQEQLEEALKWASAALDLLVQLRSSREIEVRYLYEVKFNNLPGWILHLQDALRQLGVEPDPNVALRAADADSAWSFMEMLARTRADLAGALPPDLARREQELNRKLSQVESSDSASLQERHEIHREFAAFVDKLRKTHPRFAALKYPDLPSFARIRSKLQADETALSIVLSDERAYAVIVHRDGAQCVSLGPDKPIRDLAKAAGTAIQSGGGTNELAALSELICNPVLENLKTPKLIIVSSGPLGGIAFESLSAGQGNCLANNFEVTYQPSFAVMDLVREMAGADDRLPDRLLALGNPVYTDPASRTEDAESRGISEETINALHRYSEPLRTGWTPLPGTQVEVAAVAEYFPTEGSTILVGGDATEATLLSLDWKDYDHLHFACHGALEEGPGAEPALILSLAGNQSPHDGLLTLSEIVSRPHRSRLTVLSACLTGLPGKELPKTGVSSLGRAFLLSGSRAVVVSLWPVDDLATAKLMSEFYRLMREEKMPPAKALSESKRILREDRRTRHPFYWAPFVLVGN